MQKQLERLHREAQQKIANMTTVQMLEDYHRFLLGKKGSLNLILKQLKDLPIEEKKVIGKLANDLKKELEISLLKKKEELKHEQFKIREGNFFDTTFPGVRKKQGRLHPLTHFIQDIEDTFLSLNFEVVEGPEIEDDYHNFTALNIPQDHPARDMQDTLWAKDIPYLLRTQTSSVQIRYMESHKPPLRIICPGRVFRKDDMDATHSPMFHQFEGLMVDKTTNFTHLKGILTIALRRLIHPTLELRFRSGFFPFVEPGLEVDVTCVICNGKGCSICKKSGWLEMLGCGMVHPNVFRAVGIKPDEYQGFAFGAGIERLLMIKHKIHDIRLFYENDPRFLEQFPLIH